MVHHIHKRFSSESRIPSSCHKSVRSAKTRSAVCGRRTRRTNAAWRGRTKVRRRHSSQKALEKVDTRMRNVRPSTRSPSVHRCFPLCGGSDDRDRDFGPDTFRGGKGGEERTMQRHSSTVCLEYLWSVHHGSDPGAKQVKKSSIRVGAKPSMKEGEAASSLFSSRQDSRAARSDR